MANYTPTFTKPYPSGWVDKPSKTTPVTAAIMNSYDTAIAALEAYLRDNAIKNVSADTTVKSGTKTATITIDGTEYIIYSPSVSYESAITGGTKVGTITVGANTFDIYAPAASAGGSTVSVVPKTLTGTNIAEITVDGTTYQLYAPTGGGGSTVTAEAILTEGTQIGKITIDGTETILYAPKASPITVDSELSATSENAIQNKVVKAEFDKLNSNLGGLNANVMLTRNYDAPRCVLTDNQNTITSDYGYTYADLSNMLTNGDYKKYIKNGDYIRLTTLNGETFNMIFNINTYKDCGDTSVGNHIDLISEHLIPSSQGWQMRTENTNNGTSDVPNPFLASTNMINKLSTYFTNNIPDGLKIHIVTKRILVPNRYSSSGTLTDDNNWEWKDLGKMWIPFEQEVTGRQVFGSREWQGGLRWYPCFQDGSQLNKRLGENGVRYDWWTASARSGASMGFVIVSGQGYIYYFASSTGVTVPLCMRFK